MKTTTQLRIVKRDGLFVVQIRKQRFWTRRWWWQDMLRHYLELSCHICVHDYLPLTIFDSKEEAETFCDGYLKKNESDIEVKTYNTGLNDIHWPGPPEMPKCKPPKDANDAK